MNTRPASKGLQSVLAMALLTCGLISPTPGQAALSGGGALSGASAAYSGDGELFLAVFDSTAGQEISYTLDLGVKQSTFLAAYQSDVGIQQFWAVNDANWASFLAQANLPNLRWAVQAYDIALTYNLYTTVQQGTETSLIDTSLIDPLSPTGLASPNFSISNFRAGMGQAATYFTAINQSGTHGATGTVLDYTVNGSSVNLMSESGKGYFGEAGGATDTLNGKLTSLGVESSFSNTVGASSWFYRLTNEHTSETSEPVLVDEFDNLTADAYWGFIYVDPALYPNSPYAGQYLLSYTLEGSGSAAALARREFAYGIGRTETTGGWRVNRLEGIAAATAGEAPAWLGSQPLGTVSSVPENGTAATLLAGLGALGTAAVRRRRGQSQR